MRKEHTMIVLGGDGSLNEVINGIKNPSKVTLDIFLPDRVMILQEAWGSRKMQKGTGVDPELGKD